MNDTTYTSTILNQHRAAQLDRENELLRSQSERPVSPTFRPTGFAVVTDWFAGLVRPVVIRPAH